jgi:drug/metabolite transporter (DMT)-like permease
MVFTRRDFARCALGHAGGTVAAGVGAVTAYGLSLWAMTVAPVALVAALRETSIVFGMGIAAVVLKERVGLSRLAAAALIAAGAAALRLA